MNSHDLRFHSRRRPKANHAVTIHHCLRASLRRCKLSHVAIATLVLISSAALMLLLNTILVGWLSLVEPNSRRSTRRCQANEFAYQVPNDVSSSGGSDTYHPFAPVAIDNSTFSLYRRPDVLDTFADYRYREHPKCNISSLSLHKPFSPLCPDRASFLKAFSGGGRIGFDAPFMPRDCDMRWYATEEVCEIFSRFEKVIVVGDSMMRHVVGALNVLLRKDLGYGAVTGWNFNEGESQQCFCTHQMDVKACSIQGVYRTSDVLQHDPGSFACPHYLKKTSDGKKEMYSPVNLVVELMLKFPLDPTEIKRFQELLPKQKPARPIAFVFGHGLWNDLDLQATVHWLRGLLGAIYEAAPYLLPENLPQEPEGVPANRHTSKAQMRPMSHILFVTPSAAGTLKPDQWIRSQGDKALQIFESSMHDLIHRHGGLFHGKGIEHMGTWNMSIQMDKWDGVHLNLRGNLLKAMGVVNWLSGFEVER